MHNKVDILLKNPSALYSVHCQHDLWMPHHKKKVEDVLLNGLAITFGEKIVEKLGNKYISTHT